MNSDGIFALLTKDVSLDQGRAEGPAERRGLPAASAYLPATGSTGDPSGSLGEPILSSPNSTKPSNILILTSVTLIMVLCFVATYVAGLGALRSYESARQSASSMAMLERLLSTLKDAETGERGYLLTADPRYLEPYNSAIEVLNSELADLDRQAKFTTLTAGEVQSIHALVDAKRTELRRTILLFNAKGHGPAPQYLELDKGKHIMDELRDVIGKALRGQDDLLRGDVDKASGLTRFRTTVFAGSLLLSLCVISWAFARISRETSAHQITALEAQAQKNLLEVTLRSIGDGVIITDQTGVITFMNDVATELTGWSTTQAQGTPCRDVFQIINESSRLPVESPVDKVISLGKIVGLANHTLLIRKDGSEIPIDDSGAPIRDSQGNIFGVVLVFRDFSGHKQAQASLLAAKEEAEIASLAKSNFLALLSHELRTPLTPVMATLSAWEQYDDIPTALHADIEVLRRSVDLEARLIDDLLDLTRITSGKLSLELHNFDFHRLVQETVELCASEVEGKHLSLNLQLEAQEHHLYADSSRLQQVLWNLLRNAVKFTPSGGSILVKSRNVTPGHVQLEVTDSGIGMDAAQLRRIFRPFEQGSQEVVRHYGGLGLGMAISRALVEAHHGQLSARSEGPGFGSTFQLDLPCVEAVQKRSTRAISSESSPSVPSEPKRILLVEDHADTAYVFEKLLQGYGYQVKTVNSVSGALEQFGQSSFDLLISDVGLPDGTGTELIQHVRNQLGRTTPAIALTGFGLEDDVKKNLEAGFNAHLTKPVNFMRLEALIITLLSGREELAH